MCKLAKLFVVLPLAVQPAHAARQDPIACTTELISVNGAGEGGNHNSGDAALTPDGRFIAFSSRATDLVPGPPSREFQIYVRDMEASTIERVSVATNGTVADGGSFEAVLSADGRFVAFYSRASNLVNAPATLTGIYLHDRQTGETTRVSSAPSGAEANTHCFGPAMSSDGNLIAFWTDASNLDPNDTNGVSDVYVHNRTTGTTRRMSLGIGGEIDFGAHRADISGNGRYVVFDSLSSLITPGDTNGVEDVFLHDLRTGTTTRISPDPGDFEGYDRSFDGVVSDDGNVIAFRSGSRDVLYLDRRTGVIGRATQNNAGERGNSICNAPAISPDGNFITYASEASNLVPGDSNGKKDIFVHDVRVSRTTRASVTPSGDSANESSHSPAVSANGCIVAFHSTSTNLAPGTDGPASDVYVRRCQPLPVRYCVNAANSTGFAATIGAEGSTSVAANAFALVAARTVPERFGVFCYAPEQAQLPLGDGFLCLAAGGVGIFRLYPPLLADTTGFVVRTVDLAQPPPGPAAILPGSNWNFQYWYRDPSLPGGSGHNLSDAVSVPFCP